ncbi:MAG: zinc ribbon domain-containing protein [bacterium]|nr:zinc ribbon domain-containing protein [bacterium]
MRYRGKKRKIIRHGFIFTGFLKCSCGCSITAETKKGHIYYRCTKKKGPCAEKYVREEKLTEQFKNTLQKVSLPDDWADNMLNELDKEKITATQSSVALVQKAEAEIKKIEIRLDNLLNDRIDGIIEKADYVKKKDSLIKEKLDLTDKIKEIKDRGNNWLEPMRDFILRSRLAKKTADEGDLSGLKAFLKNIGSNFILQGGKFEFLAQFEWELWRRVATHFPIGTGWRN